MRSIKRKDEIIEMLKAKGIIPVDYLSFVETDLTKDDNWDDAMKGCKYVLHVASPIFFHSPKD